jgi:hypothetical protein
MGMQVFYARPTKKDDEQNAREERMADEAAKKEAAQLRREADLKMMAALMQIESMGAEEKQRCKATCERLTQRYMGCRSHKQVKAVFYDEKSSHEPETEENKWFFAVNAEFAKRAHERLAVA